MKRKLTLLLAIILVIGNLVGFASKNENIEKFILSANSNSIEFSNWTKESEFIKRNLYSESLELKAYLYEHKKGEGYFIYDLSKNEVVEFSSGESPYSSYLDEFKVKKKVNLNNDKKEYLIYGGVSYYSYAVESSEATDFYLDFTSQPAYVSYNTDYISGVYDFKWYNGCAPTAAANLVYYYSTHGYPKLTRDWSSTQVMGKLAYYMGTNSSGGTSTSNIGDGIIDYMQFKGYNNFVSSDVIYPSFSNCRGEIISNRPALVSLIGDPVYSNHTVTLVGFEEGIGPNLLIIHDTWNTTPTKVYYTHSSIVKYLHKIYP